MSRGQQIHLSRSRGRLSPNHLELPSAQDTPGVLAALRWLLNLPECTSPNLILRRSKLRGLIRESTSPHWKVDGPTVEWSLKLALRRLPSKAVTIGELVHGLGEISARTHADLLEPLAGHLRSFRSSYNFVFGMLKAAASVSAQMSRSSGVQELSIAQALTRRDLNWELLTIAQSYTRHPYDVSAGQRYGLSFAARLGLKLDPSAVSSLMTRMPNHPMLAAIARAGVDSLWNDKGEAALRLLLSGNPLFTALAAVSVVMEETESGYRRSYREINELLKGAGVDAADAIWLSGVRLKEVVHARYSARHRIEELSRWLEVLRVFPDRAVGGEENVAREIGRLEKELSAIQSREAICEATIEQILTEMAECWPEDGLNDQQMKFLEAIFVNTPEIRYRLAKRLHHANNRTQILERNVEQIANKIGLRADLSSIFDEYYSPNESEFFEATRWCAKSLIMRYQADPKGVGKRTSYLIGPLVVSAEAILDEPYMATRRPSQWESAAARSISAHLFAFAVVAEASESDGVSVEGLKKLAIECSLKTLRAIGNRFTNRHLVDELAQIAINRAAEVQNLELCLNAWISASELPPILCAYALWQDPNRVKSDLEGARDLFLQAGRVPVSRRAERYHFSRMLSLIDAATVAAFQNDARDLFPELSQLWSFFLKDWKEHAQGPWSDAPGVMARALIGPGKDRDRVLLDPSFKNSRCRLSLVTQGL